MQQRGLARILVAAAVLLAGCGDASITPAATHASGASSTAGSGGGAGVGASGVGGAGGGTSGGTGGAGGASAPSFELLAWNLEQFPHSSGAPEAIAGVLSDLAPAVVAVEEIEDTDAFEALAASLPGYVATVASKGDGYVRVGMLHDSARVTVSDVETIFLDDYYAFPRPPLKAHVAVDGGFDFDLVVIHLKAQLDSESEARRRAACKDLDAWIRARIEDGADPDIVLAGDFNDKITDAASYNVFTPFLDAPESYAFLTQSVADAGDFSYIPFESLIDHVLVTTGALGAYGGGSTEAVHLEETVPSYVMKVSDHRPVLSRFGAP